MRNYIFDVPILPFGSVRTGKLPIFLPSASAHLE